MVIESTFVEKIANLAIDSIEEPESPNEETDIGVSVCLVIIAFGGVVAFFIFLLSVMNYFQYVRKLKCYAMKLLYFFASSFLFLLMPLTVCVIVFELERNRTDDKVGPIRYA